MKTCPKCGKGLQENTAECAYCGVIIKKYLEAQQAAQAKKAAEAATKQKADAEAKAREKLDTPEILDAAPPKQSWKPVGRLWTALAWVFGVLLIMAGLGGLADKEFIGAFIVLAGLLLLPPIRAQIERLTSVRVPARVVVVGIVLLIIIGLAFKEETRDPAATKPPTAQTTRPVATRKPPPPKPPPKPAKPAPLFRISAEELYSIYSANELAADDRFKKKRFIVTGEVTEITESWGAPSLELGAGGYRSILCRFEKDERPALARLYKGSRISIVGVCQGMTLTYVTFGGCRLTN